MSFFFFFNDTATTEIYTLSLHDALPISSVFGAISAEIFQGRRYGTIFGTLTLGANAGRSEEHTSELQSLAYLVCRLLLEKKKIKKLKRSMTRDNAIVTHTVNCSENADNL